ncbi:unnamed protein product, partial [marine sediment metagenome]
DDVRNLNDEYFRRMQGEARLTDFDILARVVAIRTIAEKFMGYIYTGQEVDDPTEMPFTQMGDLVRGLVEMGEVPAALYLTNNLNLARLAKADLNDDYGDQLQEALVGETVTEAYEEAANIIAQIDVVEWILDLDPRTFRLYPETTDPSPKLARARRQILDQLLRSGGVDELISSGGIPLSAGPTEGRTDPNKSTTPFLDLIDTVDEDDLEDILDTTAARTRLYLELQRMAASTDPGLQDRAQQLHDQFQELSDAYQREHPQLI